MSDDHGAPPRMAQQIDLDGNLHDLAPQNERMRLFDSAPQLRGQTHLDTDTESEE